MTLVLIILIKMAIKSAILREFSVSSRKYYYGTLKNTTNSNFKKIRSLECY